VALTYQGLDGNRRRTMILFDPVPERLSDSLAGYAFDLQPNESRSIYVTVNCDRGVEKRIAVPFRKGLRAAFHERQAANRGMATITSSNHIFNEVMCRSMADLAMLTTNTPQGPYPYAGIPWYSTTFGRDGIITALQMLWCDSRIAKGVLRRLAAFQATTFNRMSTPSPEKSRTRCAAARWRRWARSHSASTTAAWMRHHCLSCWPDFMSSTPATSRHCASCGPISSGAGLDRRAGRSRPRRLRRVSPRRRKGLVNQGWKDSQDAIFHADGSLAQGPIALCEVQGYVYAAKRLARVARAGSASTRSATRSRSRRKARRTI
jgi:glycogen debranching enzyme